MLDFYLIKDAIAKPNGNTSSLNYAGSIDTKAFEYLQKIKTIEDWIDFDSDFRWTYTQVLKKYDKLSTINDSAKSSDSKKSQRATMLSILQQAKDAESGLIAYGD
ncbi:MAG TPA: hypothetical protein PK772_00550 [Chitinophagaceae bacterium]|nr:hypothetical protein [Chitinophagaceae bacterium]